MNDYIERSKVLELLVKYNKDIAVREIERLPGADVRPERHGRWIPDEDDVVCSQCGATHWGHYSASYCEDCGAKMDGEG
ncbi:MAG: hypothetical protein NC299_09085 [Lachnospiraceae bacterium]|nr:hypothetical protein [Lachnospiraceae bacterium]